MKEIILVAGTRPNFVKIASIIRGLQTNSSIHWELIHTGQHYDNLLSDSFFQQLNIPAPTVILTHPSKDSAEILTSITKQLDNYFASSTIPNVLVVGDVNSTAIAATSAKKHNKKVLHVEAGLRSFDNTMPEEVNRIITDSISDYFFTTSEIASEQLIKEGHTTDKIFFVGNTMIDTLIKMLPKAKAPTLSFELPNSFVLLTLHRPANVDDSNVLLDLLKVIDNNTSLPVLFPVHPRTRQRLSHEVSFQYIQLIDAVPYLEFIYLQKHSSLIVTDSGGIQEEATFLNIPCITYRTTTERPETVIIGSNILAKDKQELLYALTDFNIGKVKKGNVPPLWDGKTGERIAQIIAQID
ncbi:MAG: UDP-N-acetylglucosamine 2-epimerase (non-hydrolyzing) [Cytophagaceae bacterium]